MTEARQPFLHDREVVLVAPTQCWFAPDGTMGGATIDGVIVSDVRVIRRLDYTVAGEPGEHHGTQRLAASTARIDHLHRQLDGPGADPDVRGQVVRTARLDGMSDSFTIISRRDAAMATTIVAHVRADLSPMDAVKAGLARGLEHRVTLERSALDAAVATWSDGAVTARLEAPGARISLVNDELTLTWEVEVPPRGSVTVGWSITAVDDRAVVMGVPTPAPWSGARATTQDARLQRWLETALDDLAALRLTTIHAPGESFFAAGAPWFFTLFGRDSLWAARMMLPFGTEIAASTLRALAALQATALDPAIAAAPGKIMHELRRGELSLPEEGIVLPPLYYGTHDATPLWVCVLHDAWRWGMPEAEVEAMLPTLEAALVWMRDFGDADGDGLLEYIDATQRGLANQGWKDSGDSIQWADGHLADGPIALVEVQAYAFEAAMHGAELLDHFGRPGGGEWRAWASALRERFHASYWLEDAAGPYLAIALDAAKRPVDSVTSNAGHVLGTGILSPAQARVIGARLAGDELSSGFGLRTMSTTATGYWPLSYHGGSVWAHDTAIAIAGLTREGLTEQADALIAGLLAAAEGFGFRMPELHSGEAGRHPLPYPASCRPQAWSAAAAAVVLTSVLGADAGDDELRLSPRPTVGAITVSGLRRAADVLTVEIDDRADVTRVEGGAVSIG